MCDESRSPVAIEVFLKGIQPRLKRVLVKYRIPPEDAEDVLQQALLALVYQWEMVRNPECWLLSTLKRLCLLYWRKQRRRLYTAVDTTLLDLLAEGTAPPQEKAALLCDLRSLIGRLPARCRSLLELRYHLGYEPAEVARKLGYRDSSIGKITNRCLGALMDEMLATGMAERPVEVGH